MRTSSHLVLAAALAAASTATAQFTNTNYPVPGSYKAHAVQIVDHDNDGDSDLVFGASTTLRDRVYMRPGPNHTGLTLLADYPFNGLVDIEVAQFDGYRPDIASAMGSPPRVRVRRWVSGSSITNQVLALPASFNTAKIKSADLDNDDDRDLVVVGWNSAQPRFSLNAGATFGAFSTTSTLSVAPSRPTSLTLADFNHDGKVDVVTPRMDGGASYFRNTTVGSTISFASAQTTANAGTRPMDVIADDFNGDGWLDYATANAIGSCGVYLNAGPTGTPWNTVNFAVSNYTIGTPNLLPRAITSGDYDCDGDVDLFLALGGTDKVAIMRNNGSGVFTLMPLVTIDDQPNDIDAGQIDADGHLDLATSNFGPVSGPSTVSRLINNDNAMLKPHIYQGGIIDGFSLGTPTLAEHSCPRPGAFASWIGPLRYFDVQMCNRRFGHTFPRRPAYQLPARIVRARLTVRLRADCGNSWNDTFGIGYRPAGNKLIFHKRVLDLPNVTSYGTGTVVTRSFELGNLPGGINLLPKMNAERLLDVFAQDGTSVDFVRLQLWTCERVRCLMRMGQTTFDAGTTWTSTVATAPSAWVFWFISPTVGPGVITPAGQMCLRLPMFYFGGAIANSSTGIASLSVGMPPSLPAPCVTISTQALSIDFSASPWAWCLSNTWTAQLYN